MNRIIHDMQGEVLRGDSMRNPKYRDGNALKKFDLIIANPMWNQSFDPAIYENDPFNRFETAGGIGAGKADWAWLQHTLASLKDNGWESPHTVLQVVNDDMPFLVDSVTMKLAEMGIGVRGVHIAWRCAAESQASCAASGTSQLRAQASMSSRLQRMPPAAAETSSGTAASSPPLAT